MTERREFLDSKKSLEERLVEYLSLEYSHDDDTYQRNGRKCCAGVFKQNPIKEALLRWPEDLNIINDAVVQTLKHRPVETLLKISNGKR